MKEDRKCFEVFDGYLAELRIKDEHWQLVEAPLRRHSRGSSDQLWYDMKILRDYLADVKVDTILVDGFVAWHEGREIVHYPALPFA